ncbi:MAG: tetratricopeptide repeat protein [Dichotomicrobium sp.]
MPAVLARFFQVAGVVALIGATVMAAPLRAQDEGEVPPESASESAPADIEKRLRRIEDSIIDMRAMIGALQSFAPGDSDTAAPRDGISGQDRSVDPADPLADSGDDPSGEPDAMSGDDMNGDAAPASGPSPELNQLEIQVQALAAQLSEVVQRLDRIEAATGRPTADAEDGPDMAEAQPSPEADATDQEAGASEPDSDTGFGTTTVQNPTDEEDDGAASWSDETTTAQADEAADPEAQAMFTQAYDALQAEDYSAARDGFNAFLESYPDDPLANTARYWLADASFAMGEYVDAANNFVKVYNTAPRGEKAEETLLKLAIALRRLDRPESACDALSRLDGRLESKPAQFRERVADERSRSECG